jgi:hypothetical protein
LTDSSPVRRAHDHQVGLLALEEVVQPVGRGVAPDGAQLEPVLRDLLARARRRLQRGIGHHALELPAAPGTRGRIDARRDHRTVVGSEDARQSQGVLPLVAAVVSDHDLAVHAVS